jgi:calcineurin-like phosphoesterase
MKILFIGDIVGKPGRKAIEGVLEEVVAEHEVDFVIANGENAAGGMGLTPPIALEILGEGVDVITSGNHIWAKKKSFHLKMKIETCEHSRGSWSRRGLLNTKWERLSSQRRKVS